MAIRNIVKQGDSVLEKLCKPVEKFDDRLAQLIDDMIDTLRKAKGAGLAGPQVGVLRRVFVMQIGDQYIEAVNPTISHKSGKLRKVEGCLSCPNRWGYVTRPKTCTLHAQNRNGESYELTLHDIDARCACHETDHLDGILFLSLVDEFVQVEEEV